MEINKFYCQSCAESTTYTSVKPKFCSHCGQPFAVFGSAPVKKVSPPSQPIGERDGDNPSVWSGIGSNLKPASYYKNKSKSNIEPPEDDDLDDENDEGDEGYFDPNYVPGNIKPVSFDDIIPSRKRSEGVKFGDIIKSEPNEPQKVKSKSKPGRKKKHV